MSSACKNTKNLTFYLVRFILVHLIRLMTLASMTVRDVQYAIFNLGYTEEMLLKGVCPKAPDGPEKDTILRKVKGVLCHPIGDYAVSPLKDSIFCFMVVIKCSLSLHLSHPNPRFNRDRPQWLRME